MSLEGQIEDLQVRLAHQELAIETLSDTVARQDRLIAELMDRLAHMHSQLQELRPSPLQGEGGHERPPHY